MHKTSFCLILAIILLSCRTDKTTNIHTSKSPNIIIILADDMGYGDIQAYNPKSGIATPNLNSLAQEGMRFTDAHTNSSVCTPTRYGLLTGRYAWRTRLKRHVLSGYSNHLIDPARETIASMCKRRGYHTAVVGKWHLGVDFHWKSGILPSSADELRYCAENQEVDYSIPVQNGPNTCGFDYSYILPGSLDMSPYVYLENGQVTAIPDSISPRMSFPAFVRRGEIAPDFAHQTALDRFTEKAVEYIDNRANHEDPFFLYFPLTGPHKPALPADRFVGKSAYGPYGDLVMQVDWTVGEVIRAVKRNEIEENTIIFYTSDNGSYMYRIGDGQEDHVDKESIQGYHPYRQQSNYIWRGTKADIYEGGHRVPFIVMWPGMIQAGTVNPGTICITDVFATVADITGLEYSEDAGQDSFSFKESLFEEKVLDRAPVIHHSVNGTFSIRSGKWKMVFSMGSGGRQKPIGKPFEQPYQLYDLDTDPTEQDNVIEQNPELAMELTGYLDQIRESGTSQNLGIAQ